MHSDISWKSAGNIQQGMKQMLAEHDWDYFVTINPNINGDMTNPNARFSVSDETLTKRLKKWHGVLDRQLLGTRFNNEQKKAKRTFFMAFIEGEQTNRHWHLLVKNNSGRDDQRFTYSMEYALRLTDSRASVDIQSIMAAQSVFNDKNKAVSSYSIKQINRGTNYEGWIISP